LRRGKPSMTAQRVAAHRLTFDRVPAPFGHPQADLDLTRDVAGGPAASAGRMHDYLRARTAFFDRVVVRALEAGTSQVVIGAAGYDGRAFRYAKPGVRWFELDHPSTQHDKLARLTRLGVPTSDIRFVAADFASDPIAERLVAAGLDPGSRCLFLLEGVAVYLDLAVLERLLGQLRQVAADGSRLAISVSVNSADAAARARFRRAVAAMGEPLRSTIEPDEAGDLLWRTGWEVTSGAAGDRDGDGRRDRLRLAGLLVATAVSAQSTDDD
jgi:methyltransferase (TIGR00027 family)